MSRIRCYLALAVFVACTTLLGEDESPTYRIWTDPVGGYTVNASFVDIDASTATLKKHGSGEQICVPLARLSKADIKYITNVKRRERRAKEIREELSSVETFYESIRRRLERYAQAAVAGETEQQVRERKEREIQSLDVEIRGSRFSFLAEVVDIRPSLAQVVEAGTTRDASDGDAFVLSVRHREFPVKIPVGFQATIGILGRALEPGDVVMLRCGVGNLDEKIGEFIVGYDQSPITTHCSILSLEKVDKDAAKILKDELGTRASHGTDT